MKTFKWLAVCLLTAGLTLAQSKKFSEVGNFELRSAGTIKDKDYNVDGYYFFYPVDKLEKGKLEYNLSILDNNLVEVAQKKYIDDKNTEIIGSAFNNQQMLFVMFNAKQKFIKLLSFDKNAVQLPITEIKISSESHWYNSLGKSGYLNLTAGIDDKGFVISQLIGNVNLGYNIQFIPTDGSQAWEYASDPTSPKWTIASIVEANRDYVVLLEYSMKNLMDEKVNIAAVVLDAKTGRKKFRSDYGNAGRPRSIAGTIFTGTSFILTGEYFSPSGNFFVDNGIGIYGQEVSLTGETLNENRFSWDVDVARMLNEPGDLEGTHVMLQNAMRTANGDIYVVGERYMKNRKGVSLVEAIPGVSNGQLIIGDILLFQFNKDLQLKSVQKIEKGKSKTPKITTTASDAIIANQTKFWGGFDYGFTQIDPKNDRFYTIFLDAERVGLKKNEVDYAVKAIIFDDGEITTDKITLTDKGNTEKILNVLPAKLGHVLLIEYDRTSKEVTARLEKVNIK